MFNILIRKQCSASLSNQAALHDYDVHRIIDLALLFWRKPDTIKTTSLIQSNYDLH